MEGRDLSGVEGACGAPRDELREEVGLDMMRGSSSGVSVMLSKCDFLTSFRALTKCPTTATAFVSAQSWLRDGGLQASNFVADTVCDVCTMSRLSQAIEESRSCTTLRGRCACD